MKTLILQLRKIVSFKNSNLSLNLKSKKNLLVYRDLCREKEILEQVPDKQTTEITVKLLAQGKSKEQDFKKRKKVKMKQSFDLN